MLYAAQAPGTALDPAEVKALYATGWVVPGDLCHSCAEDDAPYAHRHPRALEWDGGDRWHSPRCCAWAIHT